MMMNRGPNFPLRSVREIAMRVRAIATAASAQLPRGLHKITRALSTGISADDEAVRLYADFPAAANLDAFEPRYWAESLPLLNAEVAIALLHQTIADATMWLESKAARSTTESASAQEVKRVTSERVDASSLLANFDPDNEVAVAQTLRRFAGFHEEVADAATEWTAGVRLSQCERDAVYERRIRPDVLSSATASASPTATIIVGQPGAGVLSAAARLRRKLAPGDDAIVVLSEDRLRPYHPAWRTGDATKLLHAESVQSDVIYWFERLVQDARGLGMHLQVALEPRDARVLQRLSAFLRDDGYTVEAVFVVANAQDSALTVMAQFKRMRELGLPSRFVSRKEHDNAFLNLRAALNVQERHRGVENLHLISSSARELYENDLVGNDWRRPPNALAEWDALRGSRRSARELVTVALQWETLAMPFTRDSLLSTEVRRQVLAWRKEAIARCETSTDAAKLLRLAHEGSAFRTMDCFEFERKYPQHAHACEAMNAAIIKAQHHTVSERGSVLAKAKEDIAQCIERGEMARADCDEGEPRRVAR